MRLFDGCYNTGLSLEGIGERVREGGEDETGTEREREREGVREREG
jgi:hypothetical protein